MHVEFDQLAGAVEVTDATPNDSSDVETVNNKFPRGISFGAGTLRITTLVGNTIDFANGELAAGVIHPIYIRRVHSTGTTASPIKLYY